jgi:hypothetical protein
MGTCQLARQGEGTDRGRSASCGGVDVPCAGDLYR